LHTATQRYIEGDSEAKRRVIAMLRDRLPAVRCGSITLLRRQHLAAQGEFGQIIATKRAASFVHKDRRDYGADSTRIDVAAACGPSDHIAVRLGQAW
jgi:hypothetical protein